MTLRTLLIASAALICFCSADVNHINHKLPLDVLVPFNDLLPPPLEDASPSAEPKEASKAIKVTASTLATEATVIPEAPTATKPTKKSYHQEQAKTKDTQQVKEKLELQLALDLLPPFAEPAPSSEPEQPKKEEVRSTTHKPLTISRPTAHVATGKSEPNIAKPNQQFQARVTRPNSIASDNSVPSTNLGKAGFSDDLISQYLTNFQFTTRRPSRGPLPTLTPFPRYIKK